MPEAFIRSLGLVKWACAKANAELGVLSSRKAACIERAALEVYEGRLSSHFPVDVFQTGSGTSTNMNANEVIANRARQLAGKRHGKGVAIHPNDDVNLGQSSNDIIPTALHVSVALRLNAELLPSLSLLRRQLASKASRWRNVVKTGRTHLMDAVPMTAGQEFSGYAAQISKAEARCRRAIFVLSELAVGGTAIGTGLNTHPRFGRTVCRIITQKTGMRFSEAGNHFELQGARDDCVEVAGQLQAIGAALTKLANDIRLLGSGPRAGLAELKLPETQPGSSIMPGKVNPVMCEMLIQVCHYSQGMSTVVAACGRDGQLELNVNLPLITHCLHEAIGCMSRGAAVFADRCLKGLEIDRSRCSHHVAQSLMRATALNPLLGYDEASRVAKRALRESRTLRDIVLEEKLLPAGVLDRALDPKAMIHPARTPRRKTARKP